MLTFILKQRLAHLGGLGATNVAQRDLVLFSAIFPLSHTKINYKNSPSIFIFSGGM